MIHKKHNYRVATISVFHLTNSLKTMISLPTFQLKKNDLFLFHHIPFCLEILKIVDVCLDSLLHIVSTLHSAWGEFPKKCNLGNLKFWNFSNGTTYPIGPKEWWKNFKIFFRYGNLATRYLNHSSEIKCFYLMKWPNEMLQNLQYFWNTKIYLVFSVLFHATLFFP